MRLTTRIKRSEQMIRVVRPFDLTANDLIYPIFIREDGKTFEIPSMKGQRYYSLEESSAVCSRVVELGIPAIMVFGLIDGKDVDGSVALQKNGFHSQIFRKLKKEFAEDLLFISNVCLCDYTVSGACVYMEANKVLNEQTAEMLGKISVIHAEAGADVVAPAAMADGQVRHMRMALDDSGFEDVPVMSYIKTDSYLFQPFFKAVSSSKTPRKGIDPSKFRTDIINQKMFMAKVDLDIREGADIIIVKPAVTNLDLISLTKQRYPNIPIAAYQVSGEYAMIKSFSKDFNLDENDFLLEMLYSIKRAGADTILSYHSMQAAQLLG